MPIIIWGSRGITSEVGSGHFYCPHCDNDEPYRLMSSRPFFTLFFIPLFPIGGAQKYVECQRCRGTFQERVLQMEPPSEGDRLLRALYQELRNGTSLEAAQKKMVDAGMERDQAEKLTEQMSEGKAWACRDCGEHYLASVKRCPQCRG